MSRGRVGVAELYQPLFSQCKIAQNVQTKVQQYETSMNRETEKSIIKMVLKFTGRTSIGASSPTAENRAAFFCDDSPKTLYQASSFNV